MTIKYRTFYIVATAYLCIPIFIFFIGFLKAVFAAVFGLLLILGAVLAVRRLSGTKDTDGLGAKEVFIDTKTLIAAIIIFLLWCFIAGIGGVMWQTYDFCVRNAVMNDLVEFKWPLFYDMSLQQNPEVHAYFGDGTFAFVYYVTYWMVPALAGKLFGITVGRIVLLLWSAFGIMLAFIGVAFINKKATIITALIFVFFSGIDMLPYAARIMLNNADNVFSAEGYAEYFTFCSNTTSIFNVFNQVIPVWLIVTLLMTCDGRDTGFTGALTFCYSPWGTLTVFPIAIYSLIKKAREKKLEGQAFKTVLSVNNILVPAVLVTVFGTLYMAGNSATSLKGFVFEFYPVGGIVVRYLLLMVFDLLPFVLLLYKDCKKNGYFLVATAILALLPFYKITFWNDFNTRGSMAPLFVLCILLCGVAENKIFDKSVKGKAKEKLKTLQAVFLLVMFLGGLTGLGSIFEGIMNTVTGAETAANGIGSFGNIADANYMYIVEEQFFVKDYSDSLYFKYLSK